MALTSQFNSYWNVIFGNDSVYQILWFLRTIRTGHFKNIRNGSERFGAFGICSCAAVTKSIIIIYRQTTAIIVKIAFQFETLALFIWFWKFKIYFRPWYFKPIFEKFFWNISEKFLKKYGIHWFKKNAKFWIINVSLANVTWFSMSDQFMFTSFMF